MDWIECIGAFEKFLDDDFSFSLSLWSLADMTSLLMAIKTRAFETDLSLSTWKKNCLWGKANKSSHSILCKETRMAFRIFGLFLFTVLFCLFCREAGSTRWQVFFRPHFSRILLEDQVDKVAPLCPPVRKTLLKNLKNRDRSMINKYSSQFQSRTIQSTFRFWTVNASFT